MRTRPAAALVVAAALAAVAGCGGGGSKKATTTSPSSTDSTPSSEATTSTSIDPALQSLLLVAADVPGFKEPATPSPAGKRTTSCDSTTAPAITALFAAPSVEGSTFEKGTGGAVKVSSSATGATPEQATAGLTELVDPKLQACLEADLKAAAEKDLPSGSTITLKLTAAKSTVAGVEQTVLLSGIGTLKGDTTAGSGAPSTTSKTAKTVRLDLVFLRTSGTVLVVTYSGPTDQATVAERQKLVTIAVKKLTSASSTSTTVAGGSTTSSVGGTTTTRKSTSTTRHGATTTKKSTTSSSTP